MTDNPRDEFREFRRGQYHKPPIGSTIYEQVSPSTGIINGELAPCTDEEFAAGLQAQGWQQAGYISVEGGRVFDVAPDGTRTEITAE